jgi:hypothetical protein
MWKLALAPAPATPYIAASRNPDEEAAMAAKKNAAAQDLRTPKYRLRIVKNLKKAYTRRPKHPARAAESLSAPVTAA